MTINKAAAQARLEEIAAEVRRITSNKQAGKKMIDHANRLMDEGEALQDQLATYKKACAMSSYGSPAEWGVDGNPGDHDGGPAFKGFAPGMENRIQPTSMYQIDRTQIKALQQASLQGTPFKVQIGSKGIEHGYMGGIRDKAAVGEGGLTPNLLPPLQMVGPGGYWSLPYELTRVANHLITVPMQGAGIAYFQHTGNAAEAGYVAEGTLKPDISPTVKEVYTRPAKVAGRVLLTHEIVQDAGDAFAGNLVSDLARSLYNAESDLLLNGTTAANGFNGINQVTGTLTQALGADTPLDCLSKAFVALRNDFFIPDLCIVHPSTMGAIRRLKDSNLRYQLDLLEGAGKIAGTADQETLWGVPTVQSTQQAAGTAAVLSVQSGAAVVYVREALTTFFDPYSMASTNTFQYIAETRIALATPRPQAINLVSGLPTS